MGITRKNFWNVCDKFSQGQIWKKENVQWKLHQQVTNLTEEAVGKKRR